MYGYIYKTTNLINNKIYIGQHKSDVYNPNYKGSGKMLTLAIKKYGKENFKVELLEEVESKELLDGREIYYIKLFNSRNPEIGYNITQGGQIGFFTGLNHTQESKEKCADYQRGKVHLPTTAGRIWVNKDKINHVINLSELDFYLSLGYQKGRYYDKPIKIWNKGLDKSDSRIIKMITTRMSGVGFNSTFMKEHNPNKNTDDDLINNIINKGFYEYWLEYGKWKTSKYFHIRLETVDRCLKLIGKEETTEHKNYIRNKNRNK